VSARAVLSNSRHRGVRFSGSESVVDRMRSVSEIRFLSASRLGRFDSVFMLQGYGEPVRESRFVWRPSTHFSDTTCRLARDVAFRGQRTRDLLLLDALRRAFDNADTVASLAVIVDVKDENARRFYSQYGFLSFPDAQNRMYLPMKTVERLFGG